MDFVNDWSEKTELPLKVFIAWLGIHKSKFYNWHARYGKLNEHNGKIPRDFWLESWEKQAILDFETQYPDEGYRRLTFMMMDADIVAVSPSSVWRVLSDAGRLEKWNKKPSKKGTGFVQPLKPHEHWHIDVSYINICGTFYYLCSVLDGCSRYIVDWEIAGQMTETDIEILLQRARENHPIATPRIISDNGPQFIARDFKEFIRISGMTTRRWTMKLPIRCTGQPESTARVHTGFPTFPQPLRRVLCTAGVKEGCGNDRRWTARGQRQSPLPPT